MTVKIISPSTARSMPSGRRFRMRRWTPLYRGRGRRRRCGRALPAEGAGALALAFLDALVAMNDEIVPELAWQMGRPIRYGGEKRGVDERVRYMASIAEETLAPFEPTPTTVSAARSSASRSASCSSIAPWNYPFLTAINSDRPRR